MKHLVVAIILSLFGVAWGQSETANTSAQTLEQRVEKLEKQSYWFTLNFGGRVIGVSTASSSSFAVLAGCICALWAQNNRRNAWLWFFVGALFAPITLIVMLMKNGRLRREEYSAKTLS